jgi:hypothetical protein
MALGTGIAALRADSDFDGAVRRSNDPSLSAAERAEAREDGLDAKDRADRRALLTDIFLIGAGVGAAVTVVLLFVTRDDGDGEQAGGDAVEAGAAVGPDGAALFLRRAF